MSGNITITGPAAVALLLALMVSIGLNIWKFAQPPDVVNIGAGQSAAAAPALLPNGQPDPLSHRPKNPQDAVGMPDATGGASGVQ